MHVKTICAGIGAVALIGGQAACGGGSSGSTSALGYLNPVGSKRGLHFLRRNYAHPAYFLDRVRSRRRRARQAEGARGPGLVPGIFLGLLGVLILLFIPKTHEQEVRDARKHRQIEYEAQYGPPPPQQYYPAGPSSPYDPRFTEEQKQAYFDDLRRVHEQREHRSR
jgi:hypothetical protein